MAKTIERGSEVRYFRWNGSTHIVHRALIRNIIDSDTEHPDLDLSLLLTGSPTNRNGVENIESLSTTNGNHYWKHAFRVIQIFSDSRPYANPHIDLGFPVWLARWDATLEEPVFHMAITRNEPIGIQQTLNLFYITADGSRQNINAVPAALTLSEPIEESFWTMRRLIRELPE